MDSMAQEIRLEGRRVLVTGGARGLGESFVRALLAAGAKVAIADVLHERGQALAHELGRDACYMPMDLTHPQQVNDGVAQAARQMGGIDGLVNNAAVTDSGGRAMQDLSPELWDHVMAVNVRGPWLATVAAQPWLKASGSGRVVNVASDTALWGAPRLLAYVASKGALIAMTRAMARELGPHGITVNAIAPGLTLGESTEYVPQERHQLYQAGRAISRAQTAQDVNAALLFLLTIASGYVTGQLLPVNGGYVMN